MMLIEYCAYSCGNPVPSKVTPFISFGLGIGEKGLMVFLCFKG